MLLECGAGETGSALLIAESSDNATDCIMNPVAAIIMIFMVVIREIPLFFEYDDCKSLPDYL